LRFEISPEVKQGAPAVDVVANLLEQPRSDSSGGFRHAGPSHCLGFVRRKVAPVRLRRLRHVVGPRR
jgi:hypothetical protein